MLQSSSFAPSRQTFFFAILKFFINSRIWISFGSLAVTPMMFLLKWDRNDLIFGGVSRSGSIEMKTIFSRRQAPSGMFRITRQTVERQQRALGVVSGQFVNPKQARQQYPDRLLLEKGLPSVSTRVQSPPTLAFDSLSSFRPVMSSSQKSRFCQLFSSAYMMRQSKEPPRMEMAMTPYRLKPEQVLPSSASLGPSFNLYCSCCIQASSLFLGSPPLFSEKPKCMGFCARCLLTRGWQEGRRGERVARPVIFLVKDKALNIYNKQTFLQLNINHLFLFAKVAFILSTKSIPFETTLSKLTSTSSFPFIFL